MTRVVEVRTPARLHFGLSKFGSTGRQYSGLGVMVDGEGIVLRASLAERFQAIGPHCARVEEFAHRWAAFQQSTALPACELKVVSAPPDHIGLGIGTQLGLAVVAALSELFGCEYRDAALLVQMSGRGLRSAVGTYGFLQGGLIVDGGKLPDEPLGQLKTRADVPSDWRFVLIRPTTEKGLSGPAEKNAMASLPAVPSAVTDALQAIIENEILPAVRDGNCDAFAKAVYQYGYTAGECFAAIQGSPFASDGIADLVEHVRQLGYPGAGQSSWGPTVFVVSENQRTAEELVAQLQSKPAYEQYHVVITSASSGGAHVTEIPMA